MPATKELTQQQIRREQFKSTVRKDVLDNAKFLSPEGYSIKFYLSLQFLQQEEGLPLPDLLTQQTLQLAESQANWSGVPLRRDISIEEMDAISAKVRSDTEFLERTKQAKADSDNYVTVNYPKLIEGVMESIRLRGHTKLPEEAIALLRRSEQEEPMELGNTLIKAFDVLFGLSESALPSLPEPVKLTTVVEVPDPKTMPVQAIETSGEELVSEPSLKWADLGVETRTNVYVALYTALRILTTQYPEYFSPDKEPLDLVRDLQKYSDESLYVIFNETYTGPGAYKSMAKILVLLGWKRGMSHGRTVPEMLEDPLFEEHAKAIKEGTAKTLLPEEPVKEGQTTALVFQPPELKQEEKSQSELRTDRFPRNDEEITAFIKSAIVEIERRTREERFSTQWPMTHGQFCNLVSIPMDFCDSAVRDKLVKPNIDRSIPRFSELNFIQLLSLWRYKLNYGMKSRDVGKTMDRFEGVYNARLKRV